VLELVQARPSAINTSSGEDTLVRCWTAVWLVWDLGLVSGGSTLSTERWFTLYG
jgi:hypothetical protein